MKVLIAGLGSIGRRHMRNLQQLGVLDILLYRTHRSTLPDDELKDYPALTSVQAALDRQPEAVIISNPTALHLDIAIPAAEAGCHLLIEKPVSHNMDRITELQDAVERGGGQVLVGYHFRFHPGLQKIKKLLENSAVGPPISFRAHWGEYLPDWHPWEDYRQSYSARRDLGGGVILTLSHPIDYTRWLFGDVDALWAFTAQESGLQLDVEDSAEIGLRFANGTLGSIHLNFVQKPPSHFLEIVCDEGMIRWNNADGTVRVYSSKRETWESHSALGESERNQLFLTEMTHFHDLIRGETQPVCTLEDGIQALKISLGAYQSAQSGNSWSRL